LFFKAITNRDADLDDTWILVQSGLSWKIITQECKNQSRSSDACWEDALYQSLQDLKTKYSIDVPIEKTLRKTAEQKIIETALLKQIEKGNNTVNGIAKALEASSNFVRAALYKLTNKGTIIVDKSNKPHKFRVHS
jgi:Mn-dependent DtxR family transcriptional regulator